MLSLFLFWKANLAFVPPISAINKFTKLAFLNKKIKIDYTINIYGEIQC